MKIKVIGILFCIMLLVGLASAQSSIYRIQGEHAGVWVALHDDGTGSAYDGVHRVQFTWTQDHVAHYWFWSVPFTVSDGKLTSPSFPGDVGILIMTGS